jgi:SNF2 family DNA or RNA helicase
MPYAETTLELECDLNVRGVDYSAALAAYEQREGLAERRLAMKAAVATAGADKSTSFTALEFPNGGTLRSYQEEGVRWMLVNWAKVCACKL